MNCPHCGSNWFDGVYCYSCSRYAQRYIPAYKETVIYPCKACGSNITVIKCFHMIVMGMSSGLTLCTECDKRTACRALCPQAEAYVSQDYVSQGEVLVDMDGMLSSTNKDYKEALHTMMRRIERANIKHRDKAILALYIAHIPAEEISEYMGCSAPNVWRVIRKYTT